ncbi:MAG: nicotinate (nicotinamide) nucleotide adenylyltransferase [Ignavibacteria bacterium]|nr:nicotinate (nicotinamide) nucleotide adenylyltransferase [Ignavibacteria bacterium]
MNRIGIYGGSFDPVHNGHLITATIVAELRKLDKILLIPNWVSPLKTHSEPRAGMHRLEMLRIATAGNPLFEVCDLEINKPEVSYSIDTIRVLKEKYESIELIIGYDNLLVFDRWHKPDQIVNLVQLVVMKRVSQSEGNENRFFNHSVLLETPEIDISSTNIRKRVIEGKPITYMVPKEVELYIKTNNLYKF